VSQLIQHPAGFMTLRDPPSYSELRAYYRDRYYSKKDGSSHYAYDYDARELEHKRIAPVEIERSFGSSKGRMLEIGVGEGFSLAHFHGLGWDVRGVDFTRDGLAHFHPHLMDAVVEGDIYEYLEDVISRGETFDGIICSHVLEHVLDPMGLLSRLKSIVAPGGKVRISTPNDGSWLQNLAIENGQVPQDFYVTIPDHISYFNAETLPGTLKAAGFEVYDLLAEFPVDLYLLQSHSNYFGQADKGRQAHFSRIDFENALFAQSPEKLFAFRRACAAAGIGRALSAYIKLPEPVG
jgi:2-polyprenyl-3-methyl-5-hydroxy-6-metoxy-1,4-benzoquinol methylase